MSSPWSARTAVQESTAPPPGLLRNRVSADLMDLRAKIQKALTREPLPDVVVHEGDGKVKELEDRLKSLILEREQSEGKSDGKGGWLPWSPFNKRSDPEVDKHKEVHEKLEATYGVSFTAVDEVFSRTVNAAQQLQQEVKLLEDDLRKHADFAQATLAAIDGLCKVEETLESLGANPDVLQSRPLREEVDRYMVTNGVSQQIEQLARARYELAYLVKRCPWLSDTEQA